MVAEKSGRDCGSLFCKLKIKQTSNFMERRVKYKMKAGLKIVGAFLFVGF